MWPTGDHVRDRRCCISSSGTISESQVRPGAASRAASARVRVEQLPDRGSMFATQCGERGQFVRRRLSWRASGIFGSCSGRAPILGATATASKISVGAATVALVRRHSRQRSLPCNFRTYRNFTPVLGAVYVDPAAVVIGRVQIGDDASIWPTAVVRGDVTRSRSARAPAFRTARSCMSRTMGLTRPAAGR